MEIPIYQSQIAPPASTGRSAASEISKAQFLQGQAQQRAEKAKQVGDTVGGLLRPMLEQRETMNNEAALNEALDAYKQDAAQLGYLLETERATMGSWGPDASGNRGANMESWHTGRQERYSEGLTGDYLNRFNQMTDEIARGMDQSIMENDLKFARESKMVSDARALNDACVNADTIDPRAYTDDMVQQNNARIDEGILNGTYGPIQGEQLKQAGRQQLITSAHGAVTSDIQDGDGWTDVKTVDEDGNHPFYSGFNGALDYLADAKDSGAIDSSTYNSLVAQVDERDSLRRARGNKVQEEDSKVLLDTVLDMVYVQGQVPDMSWLMGRDEWQTKVTDNYIKPGDNAMFRLIKGMIDEAENPTDTISWDWEQVNKWTSEHMLPGETDNSPLFTGWSSEMDDTTYKDSVIAYAESHGLPANATAWILRQGRDNDVSSYYREARDLVEARFAPLIDAAKNESERQALIQQQEDHVTGLYRSMRNATFTTMEDVAGHVARYNSLIIGTEVSSSMLRPNNRKLDAAEELLLYAERGRATGMTDIPDVAERYVQLGALHEPMLLSHLGIDESLSDEYILGKVAASKGSVAEGTTAFLVRDPNDPVGSPPKWMRMSMTNPVTGEELKEEIVIELSTATKVDPVTGDTWEIEDWIPSSSPDKAADAAGVQHDIAAANRTIRSLYSTSTAAGVGPGRAELTWDGLRADFTEYEIQRALTAEQRKTIPGSPTYVSPIATAETWHTNNARNGLLSLGKVQEYFAQNHMGPEQQNEFFEYVWNTVKDDFKERLTAEEEAGEINLINRRQGIRKLGGAARVMESRLAMYGLNSAYIPEAFQYVFGVEW